MIRGKWVAFAVAGLAWAGSLAAQNPEIRAERLRQQLEARFGEQLRRELALSDDQFGRVRGIMEDYARRRRDLELEERRLRQALNFQLRPGIAADADSVGRLVDRVTEVRVEYVQLLQEEMTQLATVLTPVQRGQLFLMRDRILQRIQEIRDQRRLQRPM